MADNFFITGLPRSRTAWLAAYFTNGDVYCYHEALNGLKSKSEFDEVMTHKLGISLTGNSDSGLLLTDFNTRFPDAPIVIIERPMRDVILALWNAGIPHYEPLLALIQERMDLRFGCLKIEYDQIDNRLPDICAHIGVRYDKARHELFNSLNIQRKELTGDADSLKIWL